MRRSGQGGTLPGNTELLAGAWTAILDDPELDPALAAELLALPSEVELAQRRDLVDVDVVHAARHGLLTHLARRAR